MKSFCELDRLNIGNILPLNDRAY